ncbi:MAG: L-threonylcarbamoyladenylate synthase [Sphaerochaetaceae bacterium]|jgi:L-threonylcarbamoyladenylate synthase|nr:L-threonylcarbamoyladenylate synthase [Sphaerochaetaceae bacterium]NLV84937.1 L-threonylcarbamoyladenylate synthase [Spirochaetales bacterium]
METMIIEKRDNSAITTIVRHLASNDLVIMPCDTIYGIVGGAPQTEIALRTVKGRPEEKPFIQLMTIEMARSMVAEPIDPAIERFWPGALTVILKTKENKDTAIRVPSDPWLIRILEQLGQPIFSSSVNTSGEPALVTLDAILERFNGTVPLIVKGSSDQGTIASTILDATVRPYRLIRQGLVDVSSLLG